jgi:hypothetical protein
VSLEKKIFASAVKPGPVSERPYPIGLGWIAPVAACLMLVAMVSQSPQSAGLAGGTNPVVGVVLSNHNAAAFLLAGYQPRANSIPAETFEWTNGGGFTSSTGSISAERDKN